ncbi:MAG: LytTR family transcriptional regulator DNA-binding domain-containing protein [Clostridiaceae bacterium]|nr:LytTR family transcriptional regulator DNA-binding domain-containing protein [Clostridiaceae bacterium]
MVNGLELGKEIRRFDREAQIIYATTEPQFALRAYVASPINYLIKPIEKQQLFDTLTLAISKADLAEEQTLTVKTADSLRVIKLSDIACCEYRSHAVNFNLTNGEEVLSRTIRVNYSEYISPILKDRRFLQCHISYVVNMRWVERFAKDSFTLCGGILVPIAAKQYPAVRDAYMDYLMAKDGQQ